MPPGFFAPRFVGVMTSPKYDHALRFLQALLLILPTLFFLKNHHFVGFIGFSLVVFRWQADRKDWPFFLFAAYAALNTAYGIAAGHVENFNLLRSNGILGSWLLVFSYLAVRTISERALRYLLLLICLEAVTVYVQAWLGIRYFFEGQLKDYVGWPYYEPFPDLASYYAYPLECVKGLYELKPFGLTNNSLNIAIKLLMAGILMAILPMKHRYRMAIAIYLATALLIVRGRTSLAAFALLTVIWIIVEAYRRRDRLRCLAAFAASMGLVVLLTNTVLTFCPGKSLLEFFAVDIDQEVSSRTAPFLPPDNLIIKPDDPILEPPHTDGTAKEPVVPYVKSPEGKPSEPMKPAPSMKQIIKTTQPVSEMGVTKKLLLISERDAIWRAAVEDILKRPWFGSHSVRIMVDPVEEHLRPSQPCNGYLGILKIHGIVGSLLLAAFYFRRIAEYWPRFLLLLPLLLDNVTNDTLFWYMSLPDVLALYILTVHRNGVFPPARTA